MPKTIFLVRAVVAEPLRNKVSLLDINGDKVTYGKLDLPTGQWPYNVAVAPNGKIALTADNGNAGNSDGSVDTVSVVDLELDPPRITDRVVVGDGPGGLAISPKGDVAVALILAGSNNKSAYFYKRNGSIRCCALSARRSPRLGMWRSEACPRASPLRRTANISTSVIIWIRTSRS